jgi:hypothetical protein
MGTTGSMDQAQQALAIARDVDDPALLARALTACGIVAGFNAEVARPYFDEAISLARELNDRWRLSQILNGQTLAAAFSGDLIAHREAAEEGRDLADAIGDQFGARQCLWCLGFAQLYQGDPAGATAQFREVTAEAEAAHDVVWTVMGRASQGFPLARQGDIGAARAAADAAVDSAAELGGFFAGYTYSALAFAALAAGDIAAARDTSESAWQHLNVLMAMAPMQRALNAQVALAGGDLIAARRWADEAVTTAAGRYLMRFALMTRSRVAIAQGDVEQAERDAHDALACGADVKAQLDVPDILECLASLAGEAGSHREAARLFGAADAMGNVPAQSGSRSGTPATRPRRLRFVTRWARRTLTPPGLRARRCQPRRRSPTRSAAAANANDPPAAGHR